MAKQLNTLRILIVEHGAQLSGEIGASTHPGISFSTLAAGEAGLAPRAFEGADVIVMSVDGPGGIDRLAELCARPAIAPVIALAAQGARGQSLEHTLLLAELRGAALSLPRPIDATDLSLAALGLIRARSRAARRPRLSGGLEPTFAG